MYEIIKITAVTAMTNYYFFIDSRTFFRSRNNVFIKIDIDRVNHIVRLIESYYASVIHICV